MNEGLFLGRDSLEKVKDMALFYPCSGDDLLVPIEIFSPYVTDFWFVDRAYFEGPYSDWYSQNYGKSCSRVLMRDGRYEFLGEEIKGDIWDMGNLHDFQRNPYDIQPCIFTEIYKHIDTGRKVRIHRRRGYGFSAFRKEIESQKLGVFFIEGIVQVKVAAATCG